ncbi:MAG TPA: HAD domain-containing protein, partial [Candidatus Binatia bacterium]|nr:HAD domain-containing protein [Candidatus Binatia bacterium]
MKLIFLDVDGTLVTKRTLAERLALGLAGQAVADPACVDALNQLIAETGARIVLSSSWRFCGKLEMEAVLKLWGVDLKGWTFADQPIGLTPDLCERVNGRYQSVS